MKTIVRITWVIGIAIWLYLCWQMYLLGDLSALAFVFFVGGMILTPCKYDPAIQWKARQERARMQREGNYTE